MAQHNYFSHNRPDGSTPAQRMRAAGYDCLYVGANIAAGQPTVQKVLSTWMHSPDHCKTLMNPKSTRQGVEWYFCLQQVRVCVRWRTENAMSFFSEDTPDE